MNIFVKQVGEEAVPITAMPDDTSLDLKNRLGFAKGVSLRFAGKTVRNSMSLKEAGVKEGSVLAAFVTNKPPQGFESRKQYMAAQRVQTGVTVRSTKHHDLHQKTQAVVMQESALICKTVADTTEGAVEEIKKAMANETVPLSKSQREWAEKLNPLPVPTLNEILDQLNFSKTGNKFNKVMRLATEVEPRDLNKLLQAALPGSYKSQSIPESDSPVSGKEAEPALPSEASEKEKKDCHVLKEKKDKKKKKEKKQSKLNFPKPDTVTEPAKKRQKRDFYNELSAEDQAEVDEFLKQADKEVAEDLASSDENDPASLLEFYNKEEAKEAEEAVQPLIEEHLKEQEKEDEEDAAVLQEHLEEEEEEEKEEEETEKDEEEEEQEEEQKQVDPFALPPIDPVALGEGLSDSELILLREQKHEEYTKMSANKGLHPPSKFFRLKAEMDILTEKLKKLSQPTSAETELAKLEEKLSNLDSKPLDEQRKSAMISLRNTIEAKKYHLEVQKCKGRARAAALMQKKGSEIGGEDIQ